MALPKTAVFLVYVLAGLLPLALVPAVLRNREKPGGTGVLVIVLGGATWSFATGLGFLVRGPTVGFVLGNFVLLGASLTAVGVFLTMAEYGGFLTTSKPVLGALAVEPVAMQVIAWTNPSHHLLYRPGITFQTARNLITNYGPAFWLHAAVAYLLITAGLLLAASAVLTARGVRRRQSLAILLATLPPVVANLAFISGSTPLDPTPFGFALAALILAWALFRAQFLDLVPIARERAVSEMEDAVVTLDAEDRVVDCNPTARELLDVDADYVGTPGAQFFGAFPDVVDRFQDVDATDTEIAVSVNGRDRHFDLNISPLRSPDDEQAGRLVVLREITRLKERETQLREREQELDLLRQVQARVLRHNIRNDLSVVRGYGEVIADELDDEYGEMAAALVSKTDDLVDISAKARTIEQLVDEDQAPHELDLVAVLREVVTGVEASFSDADVELTTPAACHVEAIPSLELAFENLVENAVEHTDRVDVVVDLTCVDDAAVLTVADDGPGIPDQELAVLDAGEETPLQHGSGVGLWVVQWVVEESAATIEYETGPDGTTITVRIPR